jgi:dolichol-phosphate mannosyltransferase
MKPRHVLAVTVLLQMLLGLRVFLRFARTAGGQRIQVTEELPPRDERVTVIVPVLNERPRLGPCLEGLALQGSEVGEVLVVDGGSHDGTQELVTQYGACDARMRLVDASRVPAGWNGKAWALYVGVERSRPDATWVLTMDADVRPAALLARSLVAHARRAGVAALSVATRQEIHGMGEGLLHPALLTTLVYRFGLPGRATCRVSAVQANGQCFLARRDVLAVSGALVAGRSSRAEDVTIARCLARIGWAVGFYEAGDLAWVRMYAGWRDTWRNWPRSLPLRDQFWGLGSIIGLAEVTLVQALPVPVLLLLSRRSSGVPGRYRWMLTVNAVLAAARAGVLVGTVRAYRSAPWSYWLSPLCDLPAAVQLWRSLLRRRHSWRGRVLV